MSKRHGYFFASLYFEYIAIFVVQILVITDQFYN